jgi:hypothetical protein
MSCATGREQMYILAHQVQHNVQLQPPQMPTFTEQSSANFIPVHQNNRYIYAPPANERGPALTFLDTPMHSMQHGQALNPGDISPLTQYPPRSSQQSSRPPSIGSWVDLGDSNVFTSMDAENWEPTSSMWHRPEDINESLLHIGSAVQPRVTNQPGRSPSSSGSDLFNIVETPSTGSDSDTARPAMTASSRKRNTNGVSKRRQLTEDERKNAKKVRQMGACVRCRMFKLKVCSRLAIAYSTG